MSRFLIATVPIIGHVLPGLPIASKLIERGHEVWWYTGKRFRDRIEVTGATYVPMKAAYNYDDSRLEQEFPRSAEMKGLARLKFNLMHIFIPYYHFLPHVDVMVTNGGYGGVQIALAHGVPLVVAGTTEDKPEVAARVAWSGAGLNLKTSTPAVEQIRIAVHRVLSEPGFRQRAREMQQRFLSHDAPREATELPEQLVTQKQPATAETATMGA